MCVCCGGNCFSPRAVRDENYRLVHTLTAVCSCHFYQKKKKRERSLSHLLLKLNRQKHSYCRTYSKDIITLHRNMLYYHYTENITQRDYTQSLQRNTSHKQYRQTLHTNTIYGFHTRTVTMDTAHKHCKGTLRKKH